MDAKLHNIEAEKSLIGAMIVAGVNTTAVQECLNELSPTDFYNDAHQSVARALWELASKGVEPDVISISNALEKAGRLDSVGGITALSELTNAEHVAHIGHYSGIIAELSVRRSLVRAAQRIVGIAHDPGERALGEIVGEAAQIIGEADNRPSSGASRHVAHIAVDAHQRLLSILNGEYEGGLPVHLPTLRSVLGHYRFGEIQIVAARTSVGKTSYAISVALETALAGHAVEYYSLEQSELSLVDRMRAYLEEIDSFQLRNGPSPGDLDMRGGKRVYPYRVPREELAARSHSAAEKLSALPIHIDERGGLKASDIIRSVRANARKREIDMLVVDQLSLLDTGRVKGASEESLALGKEVLQLRNFAKEMGIHVVLLHQLGRDAATESPKISQLARSGQIEQHADLVVLLDEPAKRGADGWNLGEMALIVGKQRDGAVAVMENLFTERAIGKWYESAGDEYVKQAETMSHYEVNQGGDIYF